MQMASYWHTSIYSIIPLAFFLLYYLPEVAPGIFRRGADSSGEGAKNSFQGTIDTTNLRKNRFSTSDGASMLRRGAIAP